ncbi:PP2C family protein-serine/threonine phosphatase [Streptomyces spirodelae]|uniref:Serine/threonine-protein phosphatase n=1 Tax=Streptomyces spirodelae TaxID=2812904 RepID=A0ABS3X3N3_9ACTN|nr:PP2C family protein-serine/threonine phosphatase [Streptomyces spirodelae]MBO8189985.1 serine/threonine-protein phosphatase [Streptomyces spirodelae]
MTSPHLPKVAGIQPTVSSNSSTTAAAASAAPPTASTAPSGTAAAAGSATSAAEASAQATTAETGTSQADRARICDLASLHELTTRLVRTKSLDTALRETLRAGSALLGAPRGMIALEPGTDPGSEPSDAHGRAPERTIGLGLGRADLGQIETVPRSSAAYARILDADPRAGRPLGAGETSEPGKPDEPRKGSRESAKNEGNEGHEAEGAADGSQSPQEAYQVSCPAPGAPSGAGSDTPSAHLLASGIACPDIAADQDLSPRHREVAARLGYAATYAVPLTTESGTRLGAAVWLYDEPGEPTPRQRELLGSYLRHATEHCARLGELARTRADMATLSEELLPSTLPRVPGVTLAVRHRTGPCGGGDWYDALPLPDRAVGLAVGGVTGSGPAAVAAMGRLRASLRAYAVMEGEDPVAVLSDLELLLRLSEPSCSATALFAYAEPATRKVLLAGAGHCAPLIVGPRRIEPVETAVSAPLGMLACWEAPSAEVVLREGETLLCYTDGLLHRTGHSMDRAFARLRSAAASAPRAARDDPEALVDHVLRTVLPGPLADLPDHPEDVVLLAARF